MRLRNRTVKNLTGEKLVHQMPAILQLWVLLMLRLEGRNAIMAAIYGMSLFIGLSRVTESLEIHAPGSKR